VTTVSKFFFCRNTDNRPYDLAFARKNLSRSFITISKYSSLLRFAYVDAKCGIEDAGMVVFIASTINGKSRKLRIS